MYKYISEKNKNMLRQLKAKARIVVINGRYTVCRLDRGKEKALGVAICSLLDDFDPKIGINKAIGRAIKALKTKKSSEPVRQPSSPFVNTYPLSWTFRQAKVLANCPSPLKSVYVKDDDIIISCDVKRKIKL